MQQLLVNICMQKTEIVDWVTFDKLFSLFVFPSGVGEGKEENEGGR